MAGFRNLTAYREIMAREFRRAVKSLADVMRVEIAEVEATLGRLKLVG